jgi:ANTAR domain
LQAYAALVAELTGALAEQLQTALDSRGVIERAKGALMERERLDDQEAFTTPEHGISTDDRSACRGIPFCVGRCLTDHQTRRRKVGLSGAALTRLSVVMVGPIEGKGDG